MGSDPAPCSVRHWIRGSLIGAGSFGKVSLAINKESGELFAVKSIDCSDRAKGDHLAMDNELAILQSLNSPSIVSCLGSDYSVENGVQMRNLFMEYMAGGSLADLMKKFGGRLEEMLIRLYTRGILEGLHYLHGQGVVHCDIKGKNILIGSSGVKLADFGAAKRLGSEEGKAFLGEIAAGSSGLGSLKGTPLWMAPEVVMQVEQGPASDIWSLGCTIVEMATGRPPWSNSPNLFAALYRIGGTQELPPLPDCLSAEAKDFLQRCLQRDPKARWTSGQLLRHPFLQKKVEGGFVSPRFMAPPSPTSILDFSAGDSSDWDSQTAIANSVPLLHLQRKVANSEEVQRGGELSKEVCELRRDDLLAQGKQLQCAKEGILDVQREPNVIASRFQKLLAKLSPSPLESPTLCSPEASPSSTEGRWITVRSPRGCSEDRQKPLSSFMFQPLSPGGGGAGGEVAAMAQPVVVKSASEVNFDCLSFLRNRRMKLEEPVSCGEVCVPSKDDERVVANQSEEAAGESAGFSASLRSLQPSVGCLAIESSETDEIKGGGEEASCSKREEDALVAPFSGTVVISGARKKHHLALGSMGCRSFHRFKKPPERRRCKFSIKCWWAEASDDGKGWMGSHSSSGEQNHHRPTGRRSSSEIFTDSFSAESEAAAAAQGRRQDFSEKLCELLLLLMIRPLQLHRPPQPSSCSWRLRYRDRHSLQLSSTVLILLLLLHSLRHRRSSFQSSFQHTQLYTSQLPFLPSQHPSR